MANDSSLFRTAEVLTSDSWELDGNVFRKGDASYLPLYEAKMFHQFDHRWATYDGTACRDMSVEEKVDSTKVVIPRYWVPASEVGQRLKGRWDHGWLLGWRDICRNTDSRTTIASIIPRVGVGHTSPLMLPNQPADAVCGLYANLASFILDYAARQKVGGTHLTYGLVNQIPVLPPDTASLAPGQSGSRYRGGAFGGCWS